MPRRGCDSSGLLRVEAARAERSRARRHRPRGSDPGVCMSRLEGIYGAPRIQAELRLAHGVRVGKKRVARLMRQLGLKGADGRGGGPRTDDPRGRALFGTQTSSTDRLHARRAQPALGSATSSTSETGQGFLFLACVQDVYSRRIIGRLNARRPQNRARTRRARHGSPHARARPASSRTPITAPNIRAWPTAAMPRSRESISPWAASATPGDNALAETFFASLENRTPQTRTLHHTRARTHAHLLVHRMLLQPPPTPLQPRHASAPSRLRTTTPNKGHRGLDPRCQPKRVNSNSTTRQVQPPGAGSSRLLRLRRSAARDSPPHRSVIRPMGRH